MKVIMEQRDELIEVLYCSLKQTVVGDYDWFLQDQSSCGRNKDERNLNSNTIF